MPTNTTAAAAGNWLSDGRTTPTVGFSPASKRMTWVLWTNWGISTLRLSGPEIWPESTMPTWFNTSDRSTWAIFYGCLVKQRAARSRSTWVCNCRNFRWGASIFCHRPCCTSVVSPKWLVFCGKGFSVQARRERRAYPEVDLQGVSNEAWSEKDCRPLGCAQFGLWLRCSSVTAPLRGMLPPRASPQAKLGATKHQPFRRHNTSGTGVSPASRPCCLLHDSHGRDAWRDARATTLE